MAKSKLPEDREVLRAKFENANRVVQIYVSGIAHIEAKLHTLLLLHPNCSTQMLTKVPRTNKLVNFAVIVSNGAQHKQVRAELTRPVDGVEINGKDRIFAWFKQQMEAIGPRRDKPVVCVMDGERALWKMLVTWLTGIVCILDIFHVLERIWQAAHCFHPEGSDQAREFVNQRLRRILQGDVGYVIGGLKQMATKQNLRGAKLKQLQSAIR